MLPELDMGEVILAVNGVEDIVRKRPVRVTGDELALIATYDQKIIRLAQALCRGKTPRPYSRRFVDDYQRMLADLATAPEPIYIQQLALSFPPAIAEDVGMFIVTAANAVNYLSETYPRTVKQEMLGVRNLDVDGIRLGEWESCWTVVNDPLLVFDLISTARLQRRQVHCLTTVYPKLVKFITVALYLAMLDMRAKRPKWEPPFAQGVATLLGVPSLSQELATALQVAGQQTREINQKNEATQMAARTAAVRTAPKSQRQEITEAKEAQL